MIIMWNAECEDRNDAKNEAKLKLQCNTNRDNTVQNVQTVHEQYKIGTAIGHPLDPT